MTSTIVTETAASLVPYLPAPDLPLGWRLYVLATFAVTFVVILLNVVFVLPDLVRESWTWMHEALGPRVIIPDSEFRRRRELNAASGYAAIHAASVEDARRGR